MIVNGKAGLRQVEKEAQEDSRIQQWSESLGFPEYGPELTALYFYIQDSS